MTEEWDTERVGPVDKFGCAGLLLSPLASRRATFNDIIAALMTNEWFLYELIGRKWLQNIWPS